MPSATSFKAFVFSSKYIFEPRLEENAGLGCIMTNYQLLNPKHDKILVFW